MTLSTLIKKIGDKNINVQFLHECMTRIKTTKKGGSEVSFVTQGINPTQVANDTGNVGIVLWVPRKEWAKVISNLKG